MRSVIVGWIFFCLFSCGKKEKLPMVKPRPNIKSVMESIHDPMDSRGLTHHPEITENSYIVKSFFDEKGSLSAKEKFNEKGNLEWREVNSYINANLLSGQQLYHFGQLSRKTINRFNQNNQLIESQVHDGEGKLLEKRLAQFDSQGNRTLTTYAKKKGTLEKTATSLFDKNGNNIENTSYADQRAIQQEINYFDGRGNVVECLTKDLVKSRSKFINYHYNQRNDKTEMVILNGSLMIESRITYAYDSAHRLTNLSTFGIGGNPLRSKDYVYEFDAKGNWIRQVVFENKRAMSVIVRSIEYY